MTARPLMFIVHRGRAETLAFLQREFGEEEGITVVFDRRFGERRRQQRATVCDRRTADRRTGQEGERLLTLGWVLTPQSAAAQ